MAPTTANSIPASMDLRKITLALIISLVLSFAVRTTGTLWPTIFLNQYIVKFTIVITTIFILAQVLFFVFFYKEIASKREHALKTGSGFAIVGSFLVALLYLKNFCLVFDLNIVPLALQNPFFDATIPLASSFCHLLFFSLFKKVQSPAEHPWLNRPIAMAIIGVGIFIPLHLVVLINFLKYQKFSWIEHMPRFVAVSTLPFIVLAAILLFNFYLKFYRYLSEKNKEAI